MTAMATCDLCDLPTPEPPITAVDVEGEFCCRGCLDVTRQLGSLDSIDRDAVRDRLERRPAAPEASGADSAFLAVDGMHCATCEAFIEARALGQPGVVSAEASYATGLVRLGYDPERIDPDELPAILSGLGYDARPAADRTGPERRSAWRLLVGVFLGMPVMVWYLVFLYPRYFGFEPSSPAWTGATGPVSLVNLWLLTTLILAVTGYPILRGAYVSLRTRRPNMDLLVALAAVNAYVYSSLVVLTGGTEVYFDIAVVIVLVVTAGHHYEHRIRRRAVGQLGALTEQAVDEARRRTTDGIESVPLEALEAGDEVVIRPGERAPIDGAIVEGSAAVDESLLTGESVPVQKGPGDEVIGGSVVTDGSLVVRVPPGATSTVDRLVTLLWEVQCARPGAQRVADRLAAVFVPLVLVLAVGAAGWQLLSGADGTAAMLTGLTVLVVSCPCALGLATPLAVASGIRAGLDCDTIVTDVSVFETAPAADIVAFDKTGTLTTGEMALFEADSREALRLAAAVESYANHPIAKALMAAAEPAPEPVTDRTEHPGQGVSAAVGDRRVLVGRPSLFDDAGWDLPDDLRRRAAAARSGNRVPVVIGWDGQARSLAVVGDEPRPGWEDAVAALGAQDREIVVITGDDAAAATPFTEHPAIDRVFSNVRPAAKAAIIDRLRVEGTTAMVGDGTNDAPALATADLGIAMGRATAVAADAADVVIQAGDLSAVSTVFDVVGETNRRIRQNLAWAFLYNVIAIPVAAAGLINPLVAAVAMATSSLLVVGNSARDYRGSPAGRSTEPVDATPSGPVRGELGGITR